VPVKPASLRALTVRKTCSIQGLKQHIRVKRSFYEQFDERICIVGKMYEGGRTLRAAFACSTASQGAGRSKKTRNKLFVHSREGGR
jgi:hypothetical protein